MAHWDLKDIDFDNNQLIIKNAELYKALTDCLLREPVTIVPGDDLGPPPLTRCPNDMCGCLVRVEQITRVKYK